MREYAEQTWGKWITEPRNNFRPEIHQIIQCDEDDIGCIALIDEPDALTLEKLYILPSHQNRGIGTFLLRCLIERADAGGQAIRLRVLHVNPARQFYERNGFRIDHSSNERYFMSYSAQASNTDSSHQA